VSDNAEEEKPAKGAIDPAEEAGWCALEGLGCCLFSAISMVGAVMFVPVAILKAI
jgi:hypothetical protein